LNILLTIMTNSTKYHEDTKTIIFRNYSKTSFLNDIYVRINKKHVVNSR
jgi:hypothetical protein